MEKLAPNSVLRYFYLLLQSIRALGRTTVAKKGKKGKKKKR